MLGAEYAARARDISVQYGLEMPQDHLPIAVIAFHRGQLDLAREHSERGLELADEQFGVRPLQLMAVLGLVARWSGDLSAAKAWFEKAERQASALRWGEPSVRWWTGDHVELLLEVGLIEDAVRVLDVWEADAARVAREWVLGARDPVPWARRRRSRGCRSRRFPPRAGRRTARRRSEIPSARPGHCSGSASSGGGNGRSGDAREAIEAALDGFEQLGAATWVAKARSELGRIGGRRREEGLTPAERRVAALVAEGRTNREVAAALFLTERTVASHLTHVYAKLGVRSRTELARLLR